MYALNNNITYFDSFEVEKQLESDLNEIARGNPNNKSEDQLIAIENIKNLYNSRKKVVKLYNDYPRITCEAKYKAKYGGGLKILTL